MSVMISTQVRRASNFCREQFFERRPRVWGFRTLDETRVASTKHRARPELFFSSRRGLSERGEASTADGARRARALPLASGCGRRRGSRPRWRRGGAPRGSRAHLGGRSPRASRAAPPRASPRVVGGSSRSCRPGRRGGGVGGALGGVGGALFLGLPRANHARGGPAAHGRGPRDLPVARGDPGRARGGGRARASAPARCVWAPKLWAHASRRWTLPELLAACKALDGASFPELLRLCAANASITTALGLFREGRALGWCDRDGGASLVAMARAHDALGQGKAADALWAEAHEMARAGEIDVDAVRAAAGVPRRVGRSRRRNASSSSSSRDDAAKNKTFFRRASRGSRCTRRSSRPRLAAAAAPRAARTSAFATAMGTGPGARRFPRTGARSRAACSRRRRARRRRRRMRAWRGASRATCARGRRRAGRVLSREPRVGDRRGRARGGRRPGVGGVREREGERAQEPPRGPRRAKEAAAEERKKPRRGRARFGRRRRTRRPRARRRGVVVRDRRGVPRGAGRRRQDAPARDARRAFLARLAELSRRGGRRRDFVGGSRRGRVGRVGRRRRERVVFKNGAARRVRAASGGARVRAGDARAVRRREARGGARDAPRDAGRRVLPPREPSALQGAVQGVSRRGDARQGRARDDAARGPRRRLRGRGACGAGEARGGEGVRADDDSSEGRRAGEFLRQGASRAERARGDGDALARDGDGDGARPRRSRRGGRSARRSRWPPRGFPDVASEARARLRWPSARRSRGTSS